MKYKTFKVILCEDTGDAFNIRDTVSIKRNDGSVCDGCKIVKVTDTGFHFRYRGSIRSIQYKDVQEIMF